MHQELLRDPAALRELAAWYRSFAERAGSPAIWDARLRRAEDLEAEAERIERLHQQVDPDHRPAPAAD